MIRHGRQCLGEHMHQVQHLPLSLHLAKARVGHGKLVVMHVLVVTWHA